MNWILTADIGTTALKAAIFREDGSLAASASQEYAFLTPGPGMAELPAERYLDTFRETVRQVLAESGASPEEIRVLGLSTQGETTVLLDQAGEPLMNAVLWCDTRAGAEAAEIVSAFGSREIQRRSGQVGADAIWPGAKLLWLKNHRPELFSRIARVLQLEGWFSLKLTGRAAGEDSILGSSIYFDINTRGWWREMLAFLGLREEQLPEIVLPGSIVGHLTEEAAASFGLSTGTALCIGGIDLSCGAVGVGNVRPGGFSDVTGTALCTVTMTDHIVLDPMGGMPCYCSAVPGLYMVHAYASGGISLRWMRDLFHGTFSYDQMDLLAADCPPGAEGLLSLPHFIGSGPPDLCPDMKGMLIGLTAAHTEKHLARSLMEGVAMILCRVLEATEALAPVSDRILCLGGGAKSPVWCQIKADATGREVVTTADSENAGCLGAAILAGAAAGIFPDIETAASQLVREHARYLPDPEKRGLYRDLYRRYQQLMQCLLPVFQQTGQTG